MSMFNNTSITGKGKKSYRDLIPERFKNEIPTHIIATTYKLDSSQLNKMFMDILCKDVNKLFTNKIKSTVFYYKRVDTDKNNHIFPEEILKKNTVAGCSFHPKILLLRYELKKPTFVLIVSSMNIAADKNIESYAVTVGKYNEHNTECNGKKLAAYMNSYIGYDGIRKEIEKTDFTMNGVENIHFLFGDEIETEIKTDAERFFIVSPFTDITTPESISKLDRIYTEALSYKKENLNDEKVYINRYRSFFFHSKIICMKLKNKPKTRFIIGSSNADKNGWSNKSEFNIAFDTNENYETFRDSLEYKENTDGFFKKASNFGDSFDLEEEAEGARNRYKLEKKLACIIGSIKEEDIRFDDAGFTVHIAVNSEIGNLKIENKENKLIISEKDKKDEEDKEILLDIDIPGSDNKPDIKNHRDFIELIFKNDTPYSTLKFKASSQQKFKASLDMSFYEKLGNRFTWLKKLNDVLCNNIQIALEKALNRALEGKEDTFSVNDSVKTDSNHSSSASVAQNGLFEKLLKASLKEKDKTDKHLENIIERALPYISDRKSVDFLNELLKIKDKPKEKSIAEESYDKNNQEYIDSGWGEAIKKVNEGSKKFAFQAENAKIISEKLLSNNKHFLIADEVGLGKTITAGLTISKYFKGLKEKIKIGYICNNIILGKENVDKLIAGIKTGYNDEIEISNCQRRLETVFLDSQDKNNADITIYSLSPSTTIKVTSTGNVKTRSYAYFLGIIVSNSDKKLDSYRNFDVSEYFVSPWAKAYKGRADGKNAQKLLLEARRYLFDESKKKMCEAFRESYKEYIKNTDELNKILDQFIANVISKYHLNEKKPYFRMAAQAACLGAEKWLGRRQRKDNKIIEELKKTTEMLDKEWHESKIKNEDNYEKIVNEINKKQPNLVDSAKTILSEMPESTDPFDVVVGKLALRTFWKFHRENLVSALEKEKNEYNRICYENQLINCLIDQAIHRINEQNNHDEFNKLRSNLKYEETPVERLCSDYMKFIRKVMIVHSIETSGIDLYIADEIQNYSDIISKYNDSIDANAKNNSNADNKKKNLSEMDYLIFRILSHSNPVLIMSATPFRIHTKNSEIKNPQADVNADSQISEYSVPQSIKELKAKGVYEEFLQMVRFLLPLDKDYNKWQNEWEKYESQKADAVSSKDHQKYLEAVERQQTLLRETNILRTERYMARKSVPFISENVVVDIDETLFKEIARTPSITVSFSLDSIDELKDKKFIWFYKSSDWWIYTEDKKFYNISDKIYNSYLSDVELDETDCEHYYYIPETEDDGYSYKPYPSDDIVKDYKKVTEELFNNFFKKRNENYSGGIQFIKSTPACFSFNDGYKLSYFEDESNYSRIKASRIEKKPKLFDEGIGTDKEKGGLMYNSRIKKLFHTLFDEEELHKFLFIPPVHIPKGKELRGVFRGKRGISKRLFFTDFNMTVKSLIALISYEADRRNREKIKELFKNATEKFSIPRTPGNNKKITVNYKDEDFKIAGLDKIAEELLEYDQKVAKGDIKLEDESLKSGSPSCYNNNDIFVKSYFKYMTSSYSLNVLLAWCYDSEKDKDISLYELILRYGSWGCIFDVFDEYGVLDQNSNLSDILKAQSNPGYIRFNYDYDDTYYLERTFANGHYAGDTIRTESQASELQNKIKAFNSPFLPFCFISTSIGREGFDFHNYCRKVVHWSMEYDPVAFEQREGRINRYRCYSTRLKAEFSPENNGENWLEVMEKSADGDNAGLIPNFIYPVDENTNKKYGLVREFYYYPLSRERESYEQVLRSLDNYRALLGKKSEDSNYEDSLNNMLDDVAENEKYKYFVNLSSVIPELPEKAEKLPEDKDEHTTVSKNDTGTKHKSDTSEKENRNETSTKDNISDLKVLSFNDWKILWKGKEDTEHQIIKNGKTLVCQNVYNGISMMFREAESCRIIAGINCSSAPDIAKLIVAEKLSDAKEYKYTNLCPITKTESMLLVLGILREKINSDEGKEFLCSLLKTGNENISERILTLNTASEILRIINMFNMNLINEADENNQAILKMKNEYNTKLKDINRYDTARLLSEATDYLKTHNSPSKLSEYAFLDDHCPDKLEYEFVKALCKNDEPVFVSGKANSNTKITEHFKGYGMMDEVRMIALKMIDEKIPSGETEICFTDSKYESMINTILNYYNIPISSAKKAVESEPYVSMMLSIMSWYKNDCSMAYFKKILQNPSLKKDISSTSEYLIKSGNISKEYYLDIAEHGLQCLNDSSDDKKSKLNDIEFLKNLLDLFDNQERKYKLYDFYKKLLDFVNKYSVPNETECPENVKKLSKYLEFDNSDYSYDQLFDTLTQLISLIPSVKENNNNANGVLIHRLGRQRCISSRKHIFIVGLSSDMIIKSDVNSPVITDDDIRKYLRNDDLSKKYMGTQKTQMFKESFKYYIDSLKENSVITLSYPCYDLKELHKRTPSDIFASSSDKETDCFNSLSIVEESASEKTDVLFTKNTATKEIEHGAEKSYRYIDSLKNDDNEKDDSEIELSATSFNTLLNCPIKYILSYKYKIHYNEDFESIKPKFGWLYANQRGTLFHLILEKYVKKVFSGQKNEAIKNGDFSNKKFDENEFEAACHEAVNSDEFRLLPLDFAYEKDNEIKEIRAIAMDYAKTLHNDEYVPCSAEFKWEKKPNVPIEHKDVKMQLVFSKGSIDRIDKKMGEDNKTHYRLVDYKTGSFELFKKEYKQILVQHFVYYHSLLKELNILLGKDKFVIDCFEFIFPFEKDGKTVKYEEGVFKGISDDTKADNSESKSYNKIVIEGPSLTKLTETVLDKLVAYNNKEYNNRNGESYTVKCCPLKHICGQCLGDE